MEGLEKKIYDAIYNTWNKEGGASASKIAKIAAKVIIAEKDEKKSRQMQQHYSLRLFAEEITLAGGRYKHLNGTPIIADAYAALRGEFPHKPDED